MVILFLLNPNKSLPKLEIISFESHHAPVFQALNEAWLNKYFYVEAKDREILEHCEQNIIAKGGYIYFAVEDRQLAGCFALMKMEEGIYELGKMAVDENHQGKKIGQRMMEFAIDFGRQRAWRKIILYSHTKLGPAIYIYRKFGFVEIDLEKDTPYLRSNIKMELVL